MATSPSNPPEIPQRDSCWPEIPQRDSCWPEILKRLPVKHLGKCLCVSKKWHKLITSPSFITSHTIFITQKPKSCNLFLIRNFIKTHPEKPGKELYYHCSEHKPENPDPETFQTLTKRTYPFPFTAREGMFYRVVGTANGVICLSDDYFGNTYNIVLWNPLLNCFIQLPKPRVCFEVVGPYMDVKGFGFSNLDGDYKLIRLSYPARADGLDETPPRAEVYSVKEGKWRWVNSENVEFCVVDMMYSQCFMKGNVHWVVFERYSEVNNWGFKRNLVLLFDIESEKFKKMKLPEELTDVCPINLEICECRGLLCVKRYMRSVVAKENVERFEMWVKKEYNVGVSWCKMLSLDVGGCIIKVLHLKENGDYLAMNEKGKLVSYDPKSEGIVVVGPNAPFNIYDAYPFVESLAFLDEGCKNKRSFSPVEDDTSSSDEEEQEFTFMDVQRMFFVRTFGVLNQMSKFRRQF